MSDQCDREKIRQLEREITQIISEYDLCSGCKTEAIEGALFRVYAKMVSENGIQVALTNIGSLVMSFRLGIARAANGEDIFE